MFSPVNSIAILLGILLFLILNIISCGKFRRTVLFTDQVDEWTITEVKEIRQCLSYFRIQLCSLYTNCGFFKLKVFNSKYYF